jgi:hypothetical protein
MLLSSKCCIVFSVLTIIFRILFFEDFSDLGTTATHGKVQSLHFRVLHLSLALGVGLLTYVVQTRTRIFSYEVAKIDRYLSNVSTKDVSIAVFSTLVLMYGLLVLGNGGETEQFSSGDHLFPEPVNKGNRYICQPISGISALAFAIIGPLVWPAASQSVANPFRCRSLESLLFVVAIVLLTFGNIQFHLLCGPFGYNLDNLSMIGVISIVAARLIDKGLTSHHTHMRHCRRHFWIVFTSLWVGVCAFFATSYIQSPEKQTDVEPPLYALIAMYVLGELTFTWRLERRVDPNFIASLIMFFGALVVWQQATQTRFTGTVDDIFTRVGHGMWHFQSGASLYFLYETMRNDPGANVAGEFGFEMVVV